MSPSYGLGILINKVELTKQELTEDEQVLEVNCWVSGQGPAGKTVPKIIY